MKAYCKWSIWKEHYLFGCISGRYLSSCPHDDTSKDLLCLKNCPGTGPQLKIPKNFTEGIILSLPSHTPFSQIWLTNHAVSSSKAKGSTESALNLNSYLYAEPTVVEWLSQDEKLSCTEYQKRAAERIAAFEGAFSGPFGRK